MVLIPANEHEITKSPETAVIAEEAKIAAVIYI